MQNLFDVPSLWLTAAIWTGIALLAAFAIWTLIRAPGAKHDPGRPDNRPPRPEG